MYNPFNVFLNLAYYYSLHLYSSGILVHSFLPVSLSGFWYEVDGGLMNELGVSRLDAFEKACC